MGYRGIIRLHLGGLEPPTSGSEDQRAIHCAKGALSLFPISLADILDAVNGFFASGVFF